MAGTKCLLEWTDSKICCILYVNRVKIGWIMHGSDDAWVAYVEASPVAINIGHRAEKAEAKELLENYVKEVR